MTWHRLSLRYRIAATIFVLEMVMVAVTLWQMSALSFETGNQRFGRQTEATLNLLSDLSRVALVTEEYAELQPYFEQVGHEQYVSQILLVDANNKIVSTTHPSLIGLSPPALSGGDENFWGTRALSNESGPLGLLAVQFSRAELLQSIHETRDRGLTIAIVGMAVIAVIGLLMGYVLTRRLEILERAARRFAAGEPDVAANLSGNDEVARLGQTFDQMSRKIAADIADLRASKERFELAVSGTNDGIWDWDMITGTAFYSAHFKEMLGFGASDGNFEPSIQAWKDRIHPDDREYVLTKLEDYLSGGGQFFASDHRLRTKDGDYITAQMRGKVLRDNRARPQRMAGSLTNISERKHHEAVLQHQSLHDALTGLPNRTLLNDRLEHAILLAHHQNEPLAVVMMGMDRFKDINNTLGHQIGDELLKQIAARLQARLKETDTVARFGGDEFSLLLSGMNREAAVVAVGRVIQALEPPFTIADHVLTIEASFGVAIYPEHGADGNALIKCADVAMYAAKQAHSGYAVYDPARDQNTPRRLALMGELRSAIEEGRLLLHYQPKIELGSGIVSGVEALVRWEHPERGLVTPDEFIPLAEQSGMINTLTERVLDAGLRQQHEWARAGIKLMLAVNLSARNLQDLQLPDKIAKLLRTWQIRPEWLELEITESAIMADPTRALKILTSLHAMGIHLSIDDYGTGYSSLAYLRRLPVNELKIDRSFVKGMTHDESNAVIVQSTIDLGHNLGLRVAAEGVENLGILELLKKLGCNAAQGYYLSQPLPANELERRFRRTRPSDPLAAANKPTG
ncbi:MAG: EAL domain-containing protein [Gammaproteobacteria bacterium]|nr:EAL domain-containing protein [Gammaproteobacteria bacterium]